MYEYSTRNCQVLSSSYSVPYGVLVLVYSKYTVRPTVLVYCMWPVAPSYEYSGHYTQISPLIKRENRIHVPFLIREFHSTLLFCTIEMYTKNKL